MSNRDDSRALAGVNERKARAALARLGGAVDGKNP